MKPVIIAEKPSVARDIARALKGFTKNSAGHLENKEFILTWASGHLVTLKEPEDYDPAWKRWTLKSLPIIPGKYGLKVIPRQRKQFESIKALLKTAPLVVNACDAGREGELIFRQICELAAFNGPVQRLWISSLTDTAIREGFAALKAGGDYDNLAAAARCRSRGDWLVGINATRAYTAKHKSLLSVGRVQTPTLAMLVAREKEIREFQVEDYWVVMADFQAQAGLYQGRWFRGQENRVWSEEEAKAIGAKVQGQGGLVTQHKESQRRELPPLLYDLTSLQREANKRFSFSAARTLSAAQKLYESHKLITYPRTSSRFLTPDLIPSFSGRLQAVAQGEWQSLVTPLLPKPPRLDGRVINPSRVKDHHAIIPTELRPQGKKLSVDEQKIYDLVVRRFISVFYPPCLYLDTRVVTTVCQETFESKGKQILEEGWRKVEGGGGEQLLPPLCQGEAVSTHKVTVTQEETKPPARYSEGTLLAAMEGAGKQIEDDELREAMKEAGLGTPATRATIIERLKDVGYIEVQGKILVPTAKGEELINLVTVPDLLSPAMTGRWEKRLVEMELGNEQADTFMTAVEELAASVVSQAAAGERVKIQEFAQDSLGKCPLCGAEIKENRKAWGCSRWKPEDGGCKFAIWKVVARKKLTRTQAEELLTKGRTRELKGFISKGGKKFSAVLVIKEGKLEFQFKERRGAAKFESIDK